VEKHPKGDTKSGKCPALFGGQKREKNSPGFTKKAINVTRPNYRPHDGAQQEFFKFFFVLGLRTPKLAEMGRVP
jgi:hypothetical protein